MKKAQFSISIFLLIFAVQLKGANWYVRPAGGNYGAEDGTSYANAWDGLLNVRWGAGGVDAGDTLYVCGTHILNMTSKTPYNQGSITPHSGDSDAARVTIRGDYGGDPGIVWGAFRPAYEAWVSEGSDTYSITTPADCEGVWIFQDISGASCRWLANKASVAACKALAGSYYYDAANRRYYVHRTDGAAPNNNVYIENYGYQFINTGGKRYITYLNIKLLAMGNNVWNDNDATHMTWDGVTFAYGNYALLKVMDNCDYFVIQNCDIGYAQNGIYTISDHAGGADYYTIKDNYIHDIGNTVRAILGNNDEHGIGVQGGNGGLIEGNHLQRCGNSILLYAYTNQTLTNTIVRYNFVEDGHAPTDATYCIALSTQMNADSIHNKTGNKFYYNIVVDQPGYGYRFQFGSLQEVYNNVAVNCKWSFATEMSWGGTPDQPAVKFHNNISLNPTGVYGGHMCFASASPDACWDSDYNIFYPDGAQSFRRSGTYTNFSGWKALGYDTHSRNANPLFDNPAGGDFHLQTNSPAIDAGVYVSLNRDHEGTSVPKGFAPDIGAFEYVKLVYSRISASPLSGPIPLAVNFAGSAMGDFAPFSYRWSFGDGQSSTLQNPLHTYLANGDYLASLTVTDKNGNEDHCEVEIQAYASRSLSMSVATGAPASGTGGATDPTPGNHSYPHGTSVQASAIANINYRFSRWGGDANLSNIYNDRTSVLMDRDKSLSANFCSKCGDVNGDLSITPTDAQMAFDIFLGRIPNPESCQRENADVNSDGTKTAPRITPADAQAIFNKYLGKSEFPSDCSGNSRAAIQAIRGNIVQEITIPDTAKSDRGNDIGIPIILNSSSAVNAFGFDLAFSSNRFVFVGIERTDISQGYDCLGSNEITPGLLRVGGYSTKKKGPVAGIFIILVFRATDKTAERGSFSIVQKYDDFCGASSVGESFETRSQNQPESINRSQ
jgi:PKD repeat protein